MPIVMTDETGHQAGSRFATACEQFISLCDTDPRSERDRLWALRACLGELLARVGDLPPSDEPYDPIEEPTYNEIRGRIGPRFPSLGYYNGCLNPLAVGDDLAESVGDLIDDLADTYLELLCCRRNMSPRR